MIASRPANLDDGVHMFLDVIEELAATHVAPSAVAIDADQAIPANLVARLIASDLLVAGLPQEPGDGVRCRLLVAALLVERLAAASPAVASLAVSSHVAGAAL